MGNNFLNSLGLNNIETNQIDTVEEQPINTTNTSLEVNQEFDELYVETQIYNIVTRNYESTVKDQITLRF